MAWTIDQRKAIETLDKNLLVSAAAGSGKTAVLVERIIEMILNGKCDIDRMLVVTFTNAAAAEMRSRIHAALAEQMLNCTDTAQLDRLERQSILLSGVSIMTVHAFCQQLLRRHFSKIDLDPKFRAADENELNIFQQELVEEVFERHYSDDDPEARQRFQRFTDEFGGNERGDSDLHSLVLDLYAAAQSHPDPQGWLRSLPSMFDIPFDADISKVSWYDEAREQIKFELDAAYDQCSILQKLFGQGSPAALLDDALTISELQRSFRLGWQKLFEGINREKLFGILRPGKIADKLKQSIKNLRDDGYKKRITKLRAEYFFASPERLLDDLRAVYPIISTLVDVTIDFADTYADAKRDRCIIDFSDMEHLALKILDDKNIRAALRRRYKVVMVDEYQDTNAVQEAIMQSIASDNNLFVVGDVKQSIYRFRLADPTLFMRKYDEYPTDPDCERIELSMNFRSRAEVIDAVNFVFERLMRRDAVEIDYTEDARLNVGFEYPAVEGASLATPTELHLITIAPPPIEEDDLETTLVKTNADFDAGASAVGSIKPGKIELETQLIANRIKKLRAEHTQVYDKERKVYRELQYRDIVILLRSAARSTGTILDVLKHNGIPAYSAEEETYFRATEIQVIVSMLTVLDNARQDVPMGAVLLSPIGGFTAEELARLKLISPYQDFCTLLTTAAADPDGSMFNLTPELSTKARTFLQRLNRWRDLSMTMSVPELLSTIYRETKYYEAAGSMRDGMQRQANLRMLIDRAAAYEQTSFRGLSRFLQFIKKIRELNNDLKSARTLGENEDVVRIMTIHKSKGLEFPIVFVADLGHGFNIKDETTSPLLKHNVFGVGPYRMLEKMPIKVPTLARRVIARRGLNELLAEELRVLYVAMTRAREKLILVGSLKESAVDKYNYLDGSEAPKNFSILDARSFLDWLLLALTVDTPYIKVCKVDAKKIVFDQSEEMEAETKKSEAISEAEETKSALSIPSKMSVTELKRRFTSEDETAVKMLRAETIYRRPDFDRTTRLTGIEYGLAMHSVMQHLDLRGDLTYGGVDGQINSMVERKILSEEAARAIRRKDVTRFFESDFGRRMLRAEKIYRELPFGYLISTATLNRSLELTSNEFMTVQYLPDSDDKIFIQGIIDVLFEDDGGLILLDYKTDRVDDPDRLRQKYRLQLELYTSAVEEILKARVSEKYLYLLSSGELLTV